MRRQPLSHTGIVFRSVPACTAYFAIELRPRRRHPERPRTSQWRRRSKSAKTETLPAVAVEMLWVISGPPEWKLAAADFKPLHRPGGPAENGWFIQSVSA
jgi:hypothetical protein